MTMIPFPTPEPEADAISVALEMIKERLDLLARELCDVCELQDPFSFIAMQALHGLRSSRDVADLSRFICEIKDAEVRS